jgi:Histidine kinase-, DNA gyrase B-, and HSP90-like ATPase
MKMTYDEKMNLESKARQQKYVELQQSKKDGLGLVFADAFIRGMRDIGYKSPAWALSELTDNSIQAQATAIEIVFGEMVPERGGEQPQQIALVDDGVGMIPEMISYSVRWGGTDREGDRQGFGRYGYGLPSASVSIAKKYSVYSKSKNDEWHRVTVDIEDLANVAGDTDEIDKKLTAVKSELPDWISNETVKIDIENLESGTVVVFEEMDRLGIHTGWKSAKSIKAKFMDHFGLIYRHWLPEPMFYIDGDEVQLVDPLFLNEDGRFYDETTVMAQKIETRHFTTIATSGEEGQVTIKASYLPPNFQLADPKSTPKSAKNKRFKIMKANNGIHITRDGREIDCIKPHGMAWQNYDRNVKIEIDFDPELDEFFGITTSKQQITIDEDMWQKFMNRGKLGDVISDIRSKFKEGISAINADLDNPKEDTERPSESAMKDSKYLDTHSKPETDKQKAEGQKNLDREAHRVSEHERRSKEKILEEMEQEAQDRPFRVEYQAIEEGPFYLPKRLGQQRQLIINTAHPFYEKVFNQAPEVRAGLEVLLFVLAESEMEANEEASRFYKAERNRWSERLRNALDSLTSDESVLDAANAASEQADMEVSMTAAGED